MKAGRFKGPRKVEIIDVPIPELGENQVQIKLEVACLCASDSPMFISDYVALKAQGIRANDWCVDYGRDEMYPLNIGLSLPECIGTVTERRSKTDNKSTRDVFFKFLTENPCHGSWNPTVDNRFTIGLWLN